MLNSLPDYLKITYNKFLPAINSRLEEFKNIKTELYFYEFCFCILTPQSSAKNAIKAQEELININFLKSKTDPTEILNNKKHYIRFHNQKAKRLLNAVDFLPTLLNILSANINNNEKRLDIKNQFSGIGMKESSHFLRNIGYQNLAILDRHILRHLEKCKIITEIEAVSPKNDTKYIEIEQKFLEFANKINIPMDILDFVFFAHDTQQILK